MLQKHPDPSGVTGEKAYDGLQISVYVKVAGARGDER
jgi:hypothetical protein